MKELLEYIENFPIFYHKLMVFFQEYKLENHEPCKSTNGAHIIDN